MLSHSPQTRAASTGLVIIRSLSLTCWLTLSACTLYIFLYFPTSFSSELRLVARTDQISKSWLWSESSILKIAVWENFDLKPQHPWVQCSSTSGVWVCVCVCEWIVRHFVEPLRQGLYSVAGTVMESCRHHKWVAILVMLLWSLLEVHLKGICIGVL